MYRKALTVLSLLVICFVAVSCATVQTQKGVTLSVSGTGSVYMTADIVTFQVQISELEETTSQAQQSANKKVSEILSILRSYSVKDTDMSTTALSFNTEYEWNSDIQKSVKAGERVSQTVFVKVRNIDDFGKIVDSIGSSVSGISLNNVRFDAEDHTQAQEQAREMAYSDAFSKAETYAKAAGFTTIVPVSISDGYASVSNRNTFDGVLYSAAAKAEGYKTETPSGNLTVTVNTEIVFELK